MSDYQSYLFVGGPSHGELVAVPADMPSYQVVTVEHDPNDFVRYLKGELDPIDSTVSTKRHTYYRMKLTTSGRASHNRGKRKLFTFMVHEDGRDWCKEELEHALLDAILETMDLPELGERPAAKIFSRL
ncbi:MAG TPA: hypothetical protein VF174_10045 [Micromonosporaceae bacterium]